VRGRSLTRHIGAPVPLRAQAALTDGGSQAATNGVWDCQTRAVFAVVVTGPPGSGKTVTLTALSDALVRDGVAHAAVDVDEVAWAYPYPDLAQRCEHLRVWCAAHRSAGHETLLVAEVIESAAHLDDVLAALDADDHLLVRLDAALETLRQRIIVREPSGWVGLDHLLAETAELQVSLAELEGVHAIVDAENSTFTQIVDQIRSARRDMLS
jgi:broad-specificity NMP kinase